MTTYSELLKDPIKNREQLNAMDRAVAGHNPRCRYGNYKPTDGIPGVRTNYVNLYTLVRTKIKGKQYARPFTFTESRLIELEDSPWFTGKRNAGYSLTAMFGNAIQSAERHDAKRSDTIQKRLDEIKDMHARISK